MLFIKKNNAKSYGGNGYTGMDYPSPSKEINFAVIKIGGDEPRLKDIK